MRERSLELKVGLMILVSTVILAGFIFVLGNVSLRSGFTIYVDFDYIGSLQTGAPIKVSGIKVGKVEEVTFLGGKVDAKTNRRVQVRVTAWIEDRAADSIRSDAEFFINTAGVLGEQYLEIVPGKAWDRPPLAANTIVFDDAQVHDPPRTDLVVARLYDVLEGVSSVLRDERDGIKALIKNGAQAVTEINTLLVQNREQLGTLIGEGAQLAKEAKVTLSKVNTGLGDGRALTTLLADASMTLRSANTTMTTLTPSASALMTDATRVTGIITEQRVDKAINAADKAAQAAGQAGGLIANVDGLVTDLRAGKGTAGALLSRDELYSDIRELIRDLKRNPWKFFWKE
ncbi:MAG TPA: MlaD family protein [Kofleriaceae bacterium]|nr:MlaD family protein [Kofleriaceae bacterium]